MKGEVEMIVRGVKRWVSGGEKDIRSQKIQDLFAFVVRVIVGVLPLLGLFPCLGLFPKLGGEPFWDVEMSGNRLVKEGCNVPKSVVNHMSQRARALMVDSAGHWLVDSLLSHKRSRTKCST